MAADRLRPIAGLAAAALVLLACTPGPAAVATTPTGTASTSVPAPTGTASTSVIASTDASSTPAEIDATDRSAITTLVQQVNTSSDSLDDQVIILRAVVHPAYAGEQGACPAASVTIRLDPSYPDLRPDPAWIPAGATAPPTGSLYRLPALVEVYTDGLRTGTDLTLLRVSVLDGVAYTFPLCLV